MTTQTEEPVEVPDTDTQTQWESPRSARRRAVRADFAALRPTLLVVGALLAVAAVAVGVTLIVWSPPSAGDLPVSLTEYRIAMATNLRAGKHTIALTNDGTLGHELVVFRTDLPSKRLPLDDNGDVDEESKLLHNVADSGDTLAPGKTRSLPVKLGPGHYVAVCNLPTHYGLGMKLDLTVTQ